MSKKKKVVSFEAHQALQDKVMRYAQELKKLIVENKNLVSTVTTLQEQLQAHSTQSEASSDRFEKESLLSAIRAVKIPDYKNEMAILLRGNDLILNLLKEVLNERRIGL